MAKCLVCHKTIYYTFQGKKREYEPTKGKDAICAMCVIDRMKKKEEQDIVVQTLTNAPIYSDKQLEAMNKLLEKDEIRKRQTLLKVQSPLSQPISQPVSTGEAKEPSVSDLLDFFDNVKI